MTNGNTKSGVRQVAMQAGVSIATVSRVLNNSDKVSKVTRDRVLQVLEQSGFRPNAAAKALSTNRTRTIAAIIPTLEHSIFAVFLNAIEDQLAKAGYSLVIATHGFNQQAEQTRFSEVVKLGAEAIIFSGMQHNVTLLNMLKVTRMPCLMTSVYDQHCDFPTCGYDNRALAADAINYLAGLGHRRITVVHGPRDNNDRMRLRVSGVTDAATANGNISITLQEAAFGVAGGSAVARQWFNNDTLPDACLCLADVLALGVMFEAQNQSALIPDAFSLMGFEDLDWAAHCSPALTTIALPAADMGRAAANALVAQLDDSIPLDHQLLSGKIVERASTQTFNR